MHDKLEEGAISIATNLIEDLIQYLKKKGQKEVDKISVRLGIAFKKYLNRNLKKYSKVRTILSSSLLNLEDVFEPPLLNIDSNTYDENQFMDFIENGNFCLVSGQGGAGKSMFLKHLFIRYFNEGRGKIPILIELRNIPNEMSIKEYIHEELRSISTIFDEDLFEFSLKSGKFIFLLDGFDEINYLFRDNFTKAIERLTYSYGDNIFVVSSRPDDTFQSWSEFHIAKMVGFNKKQVLSLINKIKYDKQVKSKFRKLINEQNLFATHGVYLSNPLLCNIMVLTFDQGAEIPKKMHLFFQQVYTVLFSRHDATKGTAFRRKFQTNFNMDEYKKIFSAFSMFSYYEYGPNFNTEKALTIAKQSLDYYGFTGNDKDLLADFCSATSFLIKEGDIYSYIHRSFQEYFCAIFLSEGQVDKLKDIIKILILKETSNSVVQLLNDINQDLFEKEFLKPVLSELLNILNQIDINQKPGKAFLLFFCNIVVAEPENNPINYSLGIQVANTDKKDGFWYFIIKYLSLMPLKRNLHDFDWYKYGKNCNILEYNNNELYYNIKDETFIGTPMVEYLNNTKETILNIYLEIEERLKQKNKLLSNVFKKKE